MSISLVSAIMNLCKVNGCKSREVNYGRFFKSGSRWPNSFPASELVLIQTDSLALLLPADSLYPSLHSYQCLRSSGGSCDAPILAILWYRVSFSSLDCCTQAGSGCPIRKQIIWGIITECPSAGLQLPVSVRGSQEACVAFTKVFHK